MAKRKKSKGVVCVDKNYGGWCPDRCPFTNLPFFMWIDFENELVPTYGGPFDSYTIPTLDLDPKKPLHECDLLRYRYDHDMGGWVDGVEAIDVKLIEEEVLLDTQEKAGLI